MNGSGSFSSISVQGNANGVLDCARVQFSLEKKHAVEQQSLDPWKIAQAKAQDELYAQHTRNWGNARHDRWGKKGLDPNESIEILKVGKRTEANNVAVHAQVQPVVQQAGWCARFCGWLPRLFR